MEKTATNNDQNDQISSLFAIFRQILKKNYLQDVYSCKMYITVYRYIYNLVLIFEKPVKELILTTIDKKVTKTLPPKWQKLPNVEIFGISRQILRERFS